MTKVAVIGTQFGDEGKGKIVYALSKKADNVYRWAGGDNAGHTVVIGEDTFKLHLVPSGILYGGKYCIMGSGMVVNPLNAMAEIADLRSRGVHVDKDNLGIDERAHVLLNYHVDLDGIQEERKGKKKIGSTKKGIGPCYTDKAARIGVRFSEFLDENAFRQIIKENIEEKNRLYGTDYTLDEFLKRYETPRIFLAPFMIDEVAYFDKHKDENWLYEGAQGTMLDVDFGTYPYVTSSNPTIKGLPFPADKKVGIAKAYITRVGKGPLITKINGEIQDKLRCKGKEFGATTGRPRDCGWFDLPIARYASNVNHLDSIAFTKGDILDGIETIPICDYYELGEEKFSTPPTNRHVLEKCKPHYFTASGWIENTSKIKSYEKLPQRAKDYLNMLANRIGNPISIVSWGEDDGKTFFLEDVF